MRKIKPYQPQVDRRKKHWVLIHVPTKPKMTDEFPTERWFLVASLVSCIVGFGGFGLMLGVYLGVTFGH